MVRTSRVVELIETLASGEITTAEFIQVAKHFSEEEFRQLQNVLRAIDPNESSWKPSWSTT